MSLINTEKRELSEAKKKVEERGRGTAWAGSRRPKAKLGEHNPRDP